MDTAPQPTIPGLDPPAPSAGRLERAVFAAIADRTDLSLLELARVELCLELARVMQSKMATRRTSTYSNDAKLLAELLGFIGDGAAASDVDAELLKAIDLWTREESRPAS